MLPWPRCLKTVRCWQLQETLFLVVVCGIIWHSPDILQFATACPLTALLVVVPCSHRSKCGRWTHLRVVFQQVTAQDSPFLWLSLLTLPTVSSLLQAICQMLLARPRKREKERLKKGDWETGWKEKIHIFADFQESLKRFSRVPAEIFKSPCRYLQESQQRFSRVPAQIFKSPCRDLHESLERFSRVLHSRVAFSR